LKREVFSRLGCLPQLFTLFVWVVARLQLGVRFMQGPASPARRLKMPRITDGKDKSLNIRAAPGAKAVAR
jgi:hypothetical protein